MLQPIDLQVGCPSPSLFPREDLIKSAQSTLSNNEVASAALIYGPDPGYQPLRESIARWLTDFYRPSAGPISASQICISNGASGNLANILAKFTDPLYTRRIWMVEPTYFLACPIFEDAGFSGRLHGVPEDDEGIDLDFLRASLQQTDDDVATAAENNASAAPSRPVKLGPQYPKLYRHVIYCVPTFSNPTGKVMSLRRRESLVHLAREFDALIVADDVYDFLRWPDSTDSSSSSSSLPQPPPRLVDIDRSLRPSSPSPSPNPHPHPRPYGNAISNGTFSKLIAPGIRVSWCDGTDAFTSTLSHVGNTRSGGAPGHMASVFVDDMLRSGALQRHVDGVLVPTYARRREVMMQAVRRWLGPLGVSVMEERPYAEGAGRGKEEEDKEKEVDLAGGFFVYVLFPPRPNLPDAAEIARVALAEHKLTVAAGPIMAVAGDAGSLERGRDSWAGRGARLAWSWCEEGEIEEGVRRLADCLRGFL